MSQLKEGNVSAENIPAGSYYPSDFKLPGRQL